MNGPDTTGVESVREQILALVRETETLAGARLPDEFFFPEYLKRVIVALGAEAAAVWLVDPQQGLVLKYHLQRVPMGVFENPQALTKYRPLLSETLQSGGVRVYATGDPKLADLPTAHVQIFGALERGGRPTGALQIFQRNDAPPEARAGYLQFIERMCGFVARHFRTADQPAQGGASLADLQELQKLAAELHGSLDVKRVAAAAATDGAIFLGCDRVSIVEMFGGKPVVRAISGQDAVNPRSNQVRLLAQLVGQVLLTGERLSYAGKADGLAPQIEEPLAEYLHVSRSRQLTIVPLQRPTDNTDDSEEKDRGGPEHKHRARPLGALVAEQETDGRLRPDFDARLELLCGQTSQALVNSQTYHKILFLPVWRFLGEKTAWLKGRRLAQLAAALAGVGLLALALALIPWEYRVEGKGRLMPVNRRGVFAPWDGEVVALEVASGNRVEAGQIVLRLQNEELRARVLATESEFNEKRKQVRALGHELSEARRNLSREEVVRLQGRIAQTQIEMEGAEARLKVLTDLEKSLVIDAPVAGVVATFQLAELLANRPVKRGDLLLEIMDDTGPWRLELEIPENRLGHVLEGEQKLGTERLPVDFILATATETTHRGELEASATRSVVSDEGGAVVEMFATVDAQSLRHRRIGAEVIAKIRCGKRSLGYVLFGDVIEFLRKYLWL
ncbi:MAG: HlyD family efflux transporter periplasmic adaptor subunit [Planctomycetaceae bacterium]